MQSDSPVPTEAPAPPPGFERVHVDLRGGPRLHAIRGGSGPPVLLVPGWPQSWFAWRLVMPRLAEAGYAVVAIDPKGFGASDRPDGGDRGVGYDTGTVAIELKAAMEALGHPRFHLVGHDVGTWIAYAMAADAPATVETLVAIDAIVPGLLPSPPLLPPRPVPRACGTSG